MVDQPQIRGEVVGPKAAAEQLLSSGELDQIKPDEQDAQGDEAESWDELIGQVLTVWNSMAKTRLPVWVFSPTEVRALAGAWSPVAEKYAGPSLSIEAAAVLVTASVVLPRAAVTYKKKSRPPRPPQHGQEESNQEEQEQEHPPQVQGDQANELNGSAPPEEDQLYQDELPRD